MNQRQEYVTDDFLMGEKLCGNQIIKYTDKNEFLSQSIDVYNENMVHTTLYLVRYYLVRISESISAQTDGVVQYESSDGLSSNIEVTDFNRVTGKYYFGLDLEGTGSFGHMEM